MSQFSLVFQIRAGTSTHGEQRTSRSVTVASRHGHSTAPATMYDHRNGRATSLEVSEE
jgi:hypothetical protein